MRARRSARTRSRVPTRHDPPSGPRRPIAVIEVGTTSVRMRIAEVRPDGTVAELDSLQQPVALGKDVFTQGTITPETTDRCIQALQQFTEVLDTYGVDRPTSLRAVATSAVREARNRLAFLDRIFVATGLDVQDLTPAEVNRFTYLAIRELLQRPPLQGASDLLVVEVGGGSTDLLYLRQGRVAQAHVFRLGSLRLREMIEHPAASPARVREALEGYVGQGVRQIVSLLPSARRWGMVALGGDARLAADALQAPSESTGLCRVSVSALGPLVDRILRLSAEEVARSYRVSAPDAETLGPALLIYLRLARTLRMREFWVGQATLRDGVQREMASGDRAAPEDLDDVIAAAVEVGRRFNFDATHAANVERLARHLFRVMRSCHRLPDRMERVLAVAALLHDIGLSVSPRSHHKHSFYLIMNSDIFGLSPHDQTLAALVARYHRKALPDPAHDPYGSLSREDRVTVQKLAALLRVADALDCRYAPSVPLPKVHLEAGRIRLVLPTRRDLTMERMALQAKGEMMQRVYGLAVVLQNAEEAAEGPREGHV